jgi:FkbM family methyltransferase
MRAVVAAKKALRWLWWMASTRDRFWSGQLARHNIRAEAGVGVGVDGALCIGPRRTALRRQANLNVHLEAWEAVKALAAAGAEFQPGAPWDQVELDGLRFNVYNDQSLKILKEIFIDGVYEIGIEGQFVVVDVGMNVGTAALAFARKFEAPVYAFEPFRQTFERALENFKLNPVVAAWIRPEPCALGAERSTFTAVYCPESPGDCGLYAIPEGYRQQRATREEQIEVEPAVAHLERIRAAHPGHEIILKLDCEGAEYAIVDSLVKTDMLRGVRAILLEWHRRDPTHDPDQLRSTLLRAGFVVFGGTSQLQEVGLFHAVRRGAACTDW